MLWLSGIDMLHSQRPLMLSLSKHRALAGVLVLGACTQQTESPPGATIDCALDGVADFTNQCWIEGDDKRYGPPFTIHHPDGSFRRFVWGRENGAMVLQTADGVDRAEITIRDAWKEIQREAETGEHPTYGQKSGLEVQVSDDKYFLAVESSEE